MLLIHGDADRTVPFRQSEMMEAALKNVNVPVKLIRVEGGNHGPDVPGARNPANYKEEIVKCHTSRDATHHKTTTSLGAVEREPDAAIVIPAIAPVRRSPPYRSGS